MGGTMGRWDGATPGELAELVADSAQRPGEGDEAWAQRVRTAESMLLAKIAARTAVDEL